MAYFSLVLTIRYIRSSDRNARILPRLAINLQKMGLTVPAFSMENGGVCVPFPFFPVLALASIRGERNFLRAGQKEAQATSNESRIRKMQDRGPLAGIVNSKTTRLASTPDYCCSMQMQPASRKNKWFRLFPKVWLVSSFDRQFPWFGGVLVHGLPQGGVPFISGPRKIKKAPLFRMSITPDYPCQRTRSVSHMTTAAVDALISFPFNRFS